MFTGTFHNNFLSDPAEYALSVRKDWERFMNTGKIDGLSVRHDILKSWERSLQIGAPQSNAPEAVPAFKGNELEAHLTKNSNLISLAAPLMEEFSNLLYDAPTVLNLCDSDGIILKTVGGKNAKKHAEEQLLLPGFCLDERSSGTTGVSMVKNTRMPYAIYGYEHYASNAKSIYCCAAPIFEVGGGKMTGIVAFSGHNLDISPQAMGSVTFLARAIEGRLYSDASAKTYYLLKRYKEVVLKHEDCITAALDSSLNIVISSIYQHSLIVSGNPAKFIEVIESALEQECKPFLSNPSGKSSQREIIHTKAKEYDISCECIYTDTALAGFIVYIKDSSVRSNIGTISKGARQNLQERPVLIGSNPEFIKSVNMAKQIAKTDVPVILLGETGVGKEDFAHTIYQHSSRSGKPFIAVNCGAIPKELIASELFGYMSGAFTGALPKGSPGKIEAADGGTLFFDELGELPLDSQTYLLRVLQTKEVMRLGSNKTIPVDVRIIAATNADLKQMILEKRFRSDLYYRLNVISVEIPPLRKRLDDLPALADYFSRKFRGISCTISQSDLLYISRYSWPGNIRELINVIQKATILDQDTVTALKEYTDLNLKTNPVFEGHLPSYSSFDEYMYATLQKYNGNVSKAAKELGVARSTIYRHVK